MLSQTYTNCGDMPEARDSYFTTYYAFNKIILDIITVKFDIQVDDRTITQSTLLHDDIPGYNLLTLEFVLPPVNDDEDLILKRENPEIYAHLENVFVNMINIQDIAILKSQKDYVRNKQKLLEYMWCHTDHLVIWVVPAKGSVAIFRQFHVNALQTHCIQSTSSYFWMLHHPWVV